MKNILFRLMVAAALTLAALTLSSSAHGQQADEDATPTASGFASGNPRHFRARKFMGRQVKITAKLEMKSNTIQISRIELVP